MLAPLTGAANRDFPGGYAEPHGIVAAGSRLFFIAPDRATGLWKGSGPFANVSSFPGGINGVAADIAGLRPGRVPDFSDVSFAVGAGGPGDAWVQAPAPSASTVYPGAGVNGPDRMEFTWFNGSIKNKWLRVTVKANDFAGLLAPHVFTSATSSARPATR